jgi:hypothetical protein
MKFRYLVLLLPASLAYGLTFRVIFGESDGEPTRWDGTIQSSGARIVRIELWRAGDNDSVDGTRGWKVATAASPPGTDQRLGRIAPKGVLVTAEMPIRRRAST